jgi:predicted RNA-binding Zn-ribbon protein involved in translation (DUF1610 family)
MDSPDWLETQLSSFSCPACGRRYRGSRIRLLAEREGLFFVDLDCSRCGSHTVAIITIEQDEREPTIADASDLEHPDEGLPATAGSITADDVLEMHQFLAHFEGDVIQLFAAAGASSDGAERR